MGRVMTPCCWTWVWKDRLHYFAVNFWFAWFLGNGILYENDGTHHLRVYLPFVALEMEWSTEEFKLVGDDDA